MVRACRVCQGQITMQGFMILGIIGTEKDTLVFYLTRNPDKVIGA